MLRLRIKLNSSRSGVLYHFADDLSTVESILQNGLRISDEYQAHMRDVSPGAPIKPENVDEYRRQCGQIPFYELPVGAVCQLGNLRLKKISDHNVPSRISRCPSNVINLANDHRCTVLTSLWVLPIESAESKSEEETISR